MTSFFPRAAPAAPGSRADPPLVEEPAPEEPAPEERIAEVAPRLHTSMPSVVTWYCAPRRVRTPVQGPAAEGSMTEGPAEGSMTEEGMTHLRTKWTTYIGQGKERKVVVLSDKMIQLMEVLVAERKAINDVLQGHGKTSKKGDLAINKRKLDKFMKKRKSLNYEPDDKVLIMRVYDVYCWPKLLSNQPHCKVSKLSVSRI
jgi:hypothetical protein